MAADLIDTLFRTGLASSAAILLVLMLRRPVRRLCGARVAYALWAAVLIAAAAVLLPPRQISGAAVAEQAFDAVIDTASFTPSGPSVDSVVLLTGLWVLGACAALGVIVWRQRRFLATLGKLRRMPDGRTYVAANPGIGPALVGAWTPKVVVPADFHQRFSEGEREVMLGHERAHLNAGDTRINTALAAAQCIYWFNPLVHLAAFYMRLDQELACDETVIARYPDRRRAYAEAMLKAQLAPTSLPLGCYWPARGENPLRVRIAMLKRAAPAPTAIRAGVAGIAALSLGTGAAAWAAQPPVIVASLAPIATPGIAEAPLIIPPVMRRGAADVVLDVELIRKSTPHLATLESPQTPALVRRESPPPPRSVGPADWLAMPSVEDIAQAYPERAMRLEQTGSVRLACLIRPDGALEECRIAAEVPVELGFGQAALKLVPRFRFKPSTSAGPAARASISVPIRFQFDRPLPGQPPPPPSQTFPTPYVEPPRPRVAVVTAPDWEMRPSAEDLARAYPDRAMRLEQSGTARLTCRVRSNGTLENCRVASETPPELGFGGAAMSLVPRFRMKPTTRDGEPVEGASVSIPIQFRLSPAAPPPPPPAQSNRMPSGMDYGVPYRPVAPVRLTCRVGAGGTMEHCRASPEPPEVPGPTD